MKLSRPLIELLSQNLVTQIIDEAIDVLEKVGVVIENKEALTLLADCGAEVHQGKARFRPELIEQFLKTAPSSVSIYDRRGELALKLEGNNIHFNPGSAALTILDADTKQIRKPVTADLIKFARLTDTLQNIAAQSTALISTDVPETISDRYRLYLSLLHCSKPIITGTFSIEGFTVMRDMLIAIRGNAQNLAQKPLAIFDCCPSPPLKWSNLTCQNLIDCARAGIPAQLVSMPLAGATAPVTLAGALVQLTAENLSGVVIGQLAKPGSPIIFGASPAIFDMRRGTTPMGAIETMMLDLAANQIGKHLNLPTHAYMGLSDSKLVDYQAGLESAVGAILAALAGINVISGPGMLNFESCQSLEKLVIDNEICGMALRLVKGVEVRGKKLAEDLFGEIYQGDYFLTSPQTLRWYREEQYLPSKIINRENAAEWLQAGRKDCWQRAKGAVDEIVASSTFKSVPKEMEVELRRIMTADAKAHGLEKLPS